MCICMYECYLQTFIIQQFFQKKKTKKNLKNKNIIIN